MNTFYYLVMKTLIPMRYKIVERTPSVKEYNELRRSVDWPEYEDNLIEGALKNTFYCVVVEDEAGNVSGMGRIIGDNYIYLHIQDVIVQPKIQRKGIGRMIMDHLLAYVDHAGGKNTNVGLMSSKGREDFYKSYGFIERPSDKWGSGMMKVKS
jgi:ribosomal protein S18 acetylase RimI-like enzyme